MPTAAGRATATTATASTSDAAASPAGAMAGATGVEAGALTDPAGAPTESAAAPAEATTGTTAATPTAPGAPPDAAADVELPPYSLWRRVPEWEPRGRWLCDRAQLGWPDTMFPVTKTPWLFRLLLLVGGVLGQVTMGGTTGRHLLAAVLLVALWGWLEWWFTWDMTPLWRRLVAFTVQGALTGALIAVSPLSGLIVWSHYLICGTFFTGPLLLAGLTASSVLISAVQVGGFNHLGGNWSLTAGLFVLDVVIGLVSIGLANRREEAVFRRQAVTGRLVTEQQRTAELQARLLDQARSAGVRDERARLARDLHDTVAQGLVAVITQLEAIDEATLPSSARGRVESARDLARQGLGEARRAVNALDPPAVGDCAVADALAAVVRRWSDVNRISASVHVAGAPHSTGSDAALLRVAQEALANIARHAHANRVDVSLDYADDQVLLDIHDDGVGFDRAAVAAPSLAGGRGLPGMAERVRLAGGQLVVESEPGGGCVVSAAVPG